VAISPGTEFIVNGLPYGIMGLVNCRVGGADLVRAVWKRELVSITHYTPRGTKVYNNIAPNGYLRTYDHNTEFGNPQMIDGILVISWP